MRLTLPIAAAVWIVSAGVAEARCVQWQVQGRGLECIREVVSTPRRTWRKKRYHRKSYRIAARPPIKAPAEPPIAPITPALKIKPLPTATDTMAALPAPVPVTVIDDGARQLRAAQDRLRFELADQKRTRMPVARTAATAGQGTAFRPAAVDAPKPMTPGWPIFLTLMLVFGALITAIALPSITERLTPSGSWVRPRWQTRALSLLSTIKGAFSYGRRNPEYFPVPRVAAIPVPELCGGLGRDVRPGGPSPIGMPDGRAQFVVENPSSERPWIGDGRGFAAPAPRVPSGPASSAGLEASQPIRPAWQANT